MREPMREAANREHRKDRRDDREASREDRRDRRGPGRAAGIRAPRPNRRVAGLGACALALSGCSFVSLEPAGRDVQLWEASEVDPSCQKIATVNARVLRNFLLIPRPIEKIREELATLARNQAGEAYNASAIAPASEIDRGRQSFDVFRCSVD